MMACLAFDVGLAPAIKFSDYSVGNRYPSFYTPLVKLEQETSRLRMGMPRTSVRHLGELSVNGCSRESWGRWSVVDGS